MSGEVLYSDVKFPQKNKGRKAADQTSTGDGNDVTYADVKFTEAPSAQKQGVPHCSQEWELSSNKCYYFSNDTMNWNSSHKNCTSMGGHLVIIETVEEQRFLSEKAKQILNNTILTMKEELSHWIGLTDVVKEGDWLWVDNTTLNSSTVYWATRQHDGGKEPDNYAKDDKSGEDCVHLLPVKNNTLNIWYDSSCSSHYKRICEATPQLV
ncbi:UNVERIFIED_CONTAM: hypothetical protein FKN15_076927 [Acipenser sinensis]